MLTYLKANKLSFFKGKRLVFKESPAEKVIGDIEAAVAVDKAFATTGVDDETVLWNKSYKKNGSDINKLLTETDKKIVEAIPKKLVIDTAKSAYIAVGGDNAGTLAAAKVFLKTMPTDKKWKDFKSSAVTAAKNAPKILIDKIGKATSLDQAKKACDSLISEAEKRKETLDAAKSIDFYKGQLKNNMQMIAETCVQQKQQERFDVARTNFIGVKVKEIVPDPKKEEEDPDLDAKRQLATEYVDGLLMGAELKLGDEIEPELGKWYDKIHLSAKQGFITNFFLGNRKEKRYRSEKLTNDNSDTNQVKAYVEGLIDSFDYDNDLVLAWIKERIDSLPEGQRAQLNKVKGVLSTIYVEWNTEAHKWTEAAGSEQDKQDIKDERAWKGTNWLARTFNRKGETVTESAYKKAESIMSKKPNVKVFFKQRMAEAYELYVGKPNFETNIAAYRGVLLYEVAASSDQNNVIDMDRLNASIKPTTMIAGAEKIGVGVFSNRKIALNEIKLNE